MAIDPIKAIKASPFAASMSKNADKLCTKVGTALENSPIKDGFYKAMKHIDPTGANNAFIPMAGLMFFTVIIPRVITAAKRNPEDKEATRDEIQEILFRDLQTVAIVLFALKSANSLVASTATKATGLPMTQKPYESFFNSKEKGLKGVREKAQEIIANPVEKARILMKNLLDTLHPTAGVRALTNDEFSAKYSNFNSLEEITKLLAQVQNEKGDSKKVFNTIMKSLIDTQENIVKNASKLTNAGIEQDSKTAQEILEALKQLQQKGPDGLLDDTLNQKVQDQILEYFKDNNNSLVTKAKGLNAWLRSVALGFEALYLGWGLPALNEKRLEKKYLSKNPSSHFEYANKDSKNPLLDKHIKANEVRLYHKFLK